MPFLWRYCIPPNSRTKSLPGCASFQSGNGTMWVVEAGRKLRASANGKLKAISTGTIPPRTSPLPALVAQLYDRGQPARSEEHTSELQSRPHLVCRLLLEKKK